MKLTFDTLQEFYQHLVRHAPNGKPAKTIAAEVGKTTQVLLNESNVDYPDHKLGVELAIPIMKSTGAELDVAGFVSREAGGVHVDLSRVKRALEGKPAGDLMDLSLEAVQDFGEVAQSVRGLLAGGEFDKADCKRTTHEIWECIQILATLDKAVKAAAGVEP